MIEIEGLTKAYDGHVVVDGVSLTIPRGGLTGIIGPNGAGKSTLLGLIARLLAADRGTITDTQARDRCGYRAQRISGKLSP